MVKLLPYPALVISESSNSMMAISTASTADAPFLSTDMATLAALLGSAIVSGCLYELTFHRPPSELSRWTDCGSRRLRGQRWHKYRLPSLNEAWRVYLLGHATAVARTEERDGEMGSGV